MSAFHPLQTFAKRLRFPMMELRLSRRGKWSLIAIACLMLLLALNWERLALGVAAATAEHRPSLLEDASWNQPESASAFRHRFGNGSSEADLLEWLSANHFEIDRGTRHADRMVHGVRFLGRSLAARPGRVAFLFG